MNAINQSLKNWVSVEILMNTLAIGVILIPRLVFLIGLWQDLNSQILRDSKEKK